MYAKILFLEFVMHIGKQIRQSLNLVQAFDSIA